MLGTRLMQAALWVSIFSQIAIGQQVDFSDHRVARVTVSNADEMQLLQGMTDDGSSMISETVADPRTPPPFEAMLSESDIEFVRTLLGQITDREAAILSLRYGLKDGKRLTLKEVGVEVGLTRERVRQIELEAKEKLVEYVKNYV